MTKDQTLAAIGSIVIQAQAADSLIQIILTYVIQDGIPLTDERIRELEGIYSKKTLGQFIAEMKKRADYSSETEETLDRFLKNRNKLIHHFHELDGHALASATEIDSMTAFLGQLQRDISKTMNFLAAWIVAWQEQTGIGKGSLDAMMPPELAHVLADIKALSERITDHVFLKEERRT